MNMADTDVNDDCNDIVVDDADDFLLLTMLNADNVLKK